MGRHPENTIEGFKHAVNLGVGIESDVQLTKDNILVCFHDKSFKLEGKWYNISNLTLEELRNLNFLDKRIIPTLREVLETFNDINPSLRFSFDIRSEKVGVKLIDLILEYNLSRRVEITDRRLLVLKNLRTYQGHAKLVHTVPEKIKHFDDKKLDFDYLKNLNITTLNIVSWRANPQNLKCIIDNDFKCYVWGVNRKIRMKRIFSFRYQDKSVSAIYTDYPDIALKIRTQILEDTLKYYET
jgi:glycerophosphoryl diester phosphodiesterase